jgi:hypothetical protein
MRRACLFLLLVIGWSILLMMQDRNGWNDGWNVWNGRAAQAQSFCFIYDNEFDCLSDGRCGWDPAACVCYDVGCDPIERAACQHPYVWDDVLCECFCPDLNTVEDPPVEGEDYPECRDGALWDCVDTCITTRTYCVDTLIDTDTQCQKNCIKEFPTCPC